MNQRTLFMIVVLIVASFVFAAGDVQASDGGTCEPQSGSSGGALRVFTDVGHRHVGTVRNSDGTILRLDLHVRIARDGTSWTAGSASLYGEVSKMVLVAEATQSSVACADEDGDGIAGVTSLQIQMRDIISGRVMLVSVIPIEGDIDSFRQPVLIQIGGQNWTGWSSFYRSL